MAKDESTTTLFLDIGGVLLTNGWDHTMRQRAAENFGIDYEEMNERHHLTFDTYEEGKLTLVQYLNRVIFYKKRSFSKADFKRFMFSQSQPFPEMIEMIKELKSRYNLKVAAISNEGRELTVYRIRQFALDEFIDFFIASCFVHFRKPDEDIYCIALDIAQEPPEKVIYIEDRPMFVDVAKGLGIRGIWHRGYDTSKKALERFGLKMG